MKRDLFIHINETRKMRFQILDDNGDPLDFNTKTIAFQTAKEFYTAEIENLVIGDGIEILDMNLAIVELILTASEQKGYKPLQHVYQLIIIDPTTTEFNICLSGRLFIDAAIEV